MEFAIVGFTSEGDAPGIISLQWIDSRSTDYCWFPNVLTEESKRKLAIAHAPPEKDWYRCPIKLLRKFPSYESARSLLQDAEDISNLEFEAESLGPRKRKRKIIRLPGEESSSDSESEEFKIKSEPPSSPPSSTSNSTFIMPTTSTSSCTSLPCNVEVMIHESPVNQSHHINNLNFTLPSSTFATAADSHIQELNNKTETIAIMQENLWEMMKDLIETNKRIEQKLDSFTTNCNNQNESPITEDEEGINLISSIPLGVEDFIKLEEKLLANGVSKKRLVNICMTVEGREPKIFVCNLMRKLLLDDVGLKYSLTGKSMKKDSIKKSFEATEMYKLILEICFRNFKDLKVSIVREAVSDWLMQAKFRKSRREQRSSGRYDLMLIDKVFNDL